MRLLVMFVAEAIRDVFGDSRRDLPVALRQVQA
jgi:hypothetical protein